MNTPSDLIRQLARLNAQLRRGVLSEAQWALAVARVLREHMGGKWSKRLKQ